MTATSEIFQHWIISRMTSLHSIFSVNRLGNSMGLLLVPFLLQLKEGDLSEQFSKTGAGQVMLPVRCQALPEKEIYTTIMTCKEAKLPAFLFPFMCLGLTGLIEAQQLQHKITQVPTLSSKIYRMSNGSKNLRVNKLKASKH